MTGVVVIYIVKKKKAGGDDDEELVDIDAVYSYSDEVFANLELEAQLC
jgi:hypothetical protein